MIIIVCILVAIAAFAMALALARDAMGVLPVDCAGSLKAISVLLLGLALLANGIWFRADTYLGDLWTVFEALHKTAQGLRSSIDYFNPIGPLMEWVLSLTLLFRPADASAIVLANAIVASASLILCLWLLGRRASALTVAICGVIAVATALSPRDIDSLVTATQSSFLAPYNRWGWALLVPVTMHAALPSPGRDAGRAGGAGVAVALLFLLKLTYAAAALGLYAVATALNPARWRESAVMAGAFMAALILANIVTGGQVLAYLHDLKLTAGMPANGLRIQKLFAEIPAFLAWGSGCVLILAAARPPDVSPVQSVSRQWPSLMVALAAGAAGLVILMQNHYSTEPTTMLLMPLIVAERSGLMSSGLRQSTGVWSRQVEWLGAVLIATLAIPAVDSGFVLAQTIQSRRKSVDVRMAGSAFSRVAIDEVYAPDAAGGCASSTCSDYRRMVSGRELLQRSCPVRPGKTVLALNFSNPFPALLGIPSPRTAPTWLHSGRTFSPRSFTPPDRLFSDVGCVMLAKHESNAADLATIYAATLAQRYRLAASNDDWDLLVER